MIFEEIRRETLIIILCFKRHYSTQDGGQRGGETKNFLENPCPSLPCYLLKQESARAASACARMFWLKLFVCSMLLLANSYTMYTIVTPNMVPWPSALSLRIMATCSIAHLDTKCVPWCCHGITCLESASYVLLISFNIFQFHRPVRTIYGSTQSVKIWYA